MSRARATNGAPTSSPRVCPRVARARARRRLVSSSSRASSSSFFGFPVPPVLDPAVAISSVAEAALKTPLVLKSYGSVRVVIDAPIEAAIARGVAPSGDARDGVVVAAVADVPKHRIHRR